MMELALLRVEHKRVEAGDYLADVVLVPPGVYHRPEPGRDPEYGDTLCGLDLYTTSQLVDRRLADKLRKPCKRCWT